MSEKRHPSSLLFYFVAAALGLSFSAALIVLAWNNVVQNETRNFRFDTIAAQNAVEGSIRTADAIIDNLASFIAANAVPDKDAFRDYTAGTLQRYAFIKGLAHARLSAHGQLRINDSAGEVFSAELAAIMDEENNQRAVRQGLTSGTAAMPLVADRAQTGSRILFLLQAVASSGAAPDEPEVTLLAIDLASLVDAIAVDPGVNLALYTESEGVAGRRLVYLKGARRARAGYIVETLDEDSLVRLGGFSVRLVSSKDVFWHDLDRELVFVALFLGLGVTLLLVALARAKDIQAQELEARNRVIEEQVRQQTRELAEARDAALEASRVKSDFLASMSHEIRTPLNAIIGMADLLSETRLDDEQGKYVGVFRNAGEALLSLVNDILDLSKIEADQLTLEQIDFDLVDIVEQAAEIYALKADGRDIDLITNISPSLPRTLRGDPGRIRQIILNLIGNAIKFTDSGQIIVRVMPVAGAASSSRVHFEISDSGIGIPSEKLESIFSNFTQVDSSITRKYGGTGLGLAICKRLVEMMDGRIWAESTEGVGSSFLFEIELPAAHEQIAQALPGLPLQRALVAMPSRHQGEALADLLKAHGIAVTYLATPNEAPQSLAQAARDNAAFELVVLNHGADVGAVTQVIHALRQGGTAVPIVALFRPSTLAQGVEQLRGVTGTSYVVEPVRQAQFLEAVRLACAGPQQTRAESDDRQAATAMHARILLVEDNPDNRLLVKAYLKKEPYELVEAENGRAAVDAFKDGEFDLVLMDIQMPVMDGYAATAAIRAWESEAGARRTPIIALTANAIKEDIERSRAAGCDDHLTKPIKKQTLIGALRDRLAATADG